MRTRTVLIVILGLSACLCWAFGTAIAEQPKATTVGTSIEGSTPVSAKTDLGVKQTTQQPRGGVAAEMTGGLNRTTSSTRGNAVAQPAGHQSGKAVKTTIDRSQVKPIPAGTAHHKFYVDGTPEGPRGDRANVCVPAGGTCGAIVYEQMDGSYFFGDAMDYYIADDLWLDGSDRSICQLEVASYGDGGTYTYTVEIWTNCPAEPGAELLYGPITSPVLPAGYTETTYSIPGVTVPTLIWIAQNYDLVTATGAGPIFGDPPTIGYSEDQFGIVENTPPECGYYWFQGGADEYTAFGFRISAAGDTLGKCCYNNCANCVDTTYGDCMALAGNPEFLLGHACSEVPGCGKGACCTNVAGVYSCVANKTLAQCQALTGYVAGSWEMGTDCTTHAPYEEKFCAGIPANDDCANATMITGTCLTEYFNTAGATLDVFGGAYYTVTCLEGETPGITDDDVGLLNNIWYKYQIPTTYNGYNVEAGEVVISTLGCRYDTVVAVWGLLGQDIPCASATCDMITSGNERTCNDDIVTPGSDLHGTIQLSYVFVPVGSPTAGDAVRPGSCIYIMVSGLNQEGNPPGGPGQLNIDFIPRMAPWDGSNAGVCCTATGCFIATDVGDCNAAGGYLRTWADFYEGNTTGAPAPFDTGVRAGGCCHGDFGSCQEGEYCGKPIVLSDPNSADSNFVWPTDFAPATGLVHRVTYFKFTPRDLIGTETEYYITIDTCGSEFDTVLSVYGETLAQDPYTNNFGECDLGAPIARNDNCTLSTYGAEGRVSCASVSTTSSCMCLKAGEGGLLPGSGTYYIGVGMKDPNGLRAEGIDPVPNYPIDQAAGLKITMKDTYPNCLPCDKQCCKGDIGNGNGTYVADGVIDGKDIADMIKLLISGDANNLDCQAANDIWCRANMDNNATVDINDVPAFVDALLVPWPCDLATYCEVEGYCQLPDSPTGYGGIISDVNGEVTMADNFVSLSGGQITRVCWWGVYSYYDGSAWSPCTLSGTDDFTITFYHTADNRPDGVVAQFANIKETGGAYTLVKTATGRTVVGAPEYKYEVTGLPPVSVAAGECLWVEILDNPTAQNCWFLWEMESNAGDTYVAQKTDGYYFFVDDDYDLAFCLNIPIWEGGCSKACSVTCPAGSIAEGEPVCGVEYVDEYNGSCDLAQTVACNQTICATSGVFTRNGDTYRDTDWYKLVLTQRKLVTVSVKAEFTAVLGFIGYAQNAGSGDCADLGGTLDPLDYGRCEKLNVEVDLPAGTWYYFVAPDWDDPFYPACGDTYYISVACTDCATHASCLTCTGTAEGETCGADTNGGCNMETPAFGTITAGQTICGTSWAQMAQRDTDWFQFTLTTTRKVGATLKSEFPGAVYILRVNNCATFDIDALAAGYSVDCSEGVANAQLDAGTYIAFVAPGTEAANVYTCIDCTVDDAFNDYQLTLGTGPAPICDDTTYCQIWSPLSTATNAQITDLFGTTQYRAADDFYPTATGGITHVCWWGVVETNGGAVCPLPTMNWNIAFYQNNNGAPGTIIGTVRNVGNVAGVSTGTSFDPAGANLPIYIWQANITSPGTFNANTCYWMAIYNTTGAANGCYAYIIAADSSVPHNGNNKAGRWTGGTWGARTYDFAWCINRAASATSCP